MKSVRKTLKKYLIPHEENDHKPHLLRPQTIAFVCLVAVVLESSFLFGSSVIAPHSKLFGVIVTNALVDETNQQRVMNDIPALTVSPLLQAAAQEKANDMVTNNYFAHTSPSGLTPWYWFENVGYQFVSAGENLAVNFSDSQDVTDAWMNSPEHRANILNAGYTQIGMATAQGTYEGHPAIYVVQLFGTPAITPVDFIAAANAAEPPPTTPVVANKPVVVKPVTKVPQIVAIVTSSTVSNTSTQQSAVAIQGATINVNAIPIGATGTAASAAPTTGPAGAAAVTPSTEPQGEQSNLIQIAASNPRQVTDIIYLAIALLFGIALLLNVFIKVRIQHPQLIFGGMLVILVAGLFIVLNHHLGMASITVL